MSVDWSATGAMLAGIGTLLGAGAVIYAAHKGSDTFKQWRRQKNEERRIELAEHVLTIGYKMKRALEGVRSPGMLGGEQAEVLEELRNIGLVKDDTPTEHIGILQTAQATIMRLTGQRALWNELLDAMPTAKAVFGDEVEKALDQFWRQRNRVVAGAHRYARLVSQQPPRTEEGIEKQLKRQFETEEVIWSGGGEDGVDTVADAVNGAVQSLEVMLLPIIRGDTPFGLGRGQND